MADYKKMYIKLAATMDNCIEEMQRAMLEAEEIYVSDESLESEIAKLECDFPEFCGEQRDKD